jgi:nitrate/nitrite transporter NarK
MLRHANIWYLSLMYFCYGYVLWLFLNWLPTYFAEVRHFNLPKAGVYAMIPALAAAGTNALGGWLSDRLHERTGNLRYSRRVVAITGFVTSVVFLPLCVMADSPNMAVLAMALAFGGLELTTGVSWAVPLEVGRDQSGTVSGIMNTFGNVSAAISPLVVAGLINHFDSWTPAFVLGSVLCFVAAILWFKIDPTKPVIEEHLEVSHAH